VFVNISAIDGYLSIRFPKFTATMLYDPTISVLLPSSSFEGQSGGSNTYKIVLAVVLPVAFVGILLVVGVVLVVLLVFAIVGRYRWRRIRAMSKSTVNFDQDDA